METTKPHLRSKHIRTASDISSAVIKDRRVHNSLSISFNACMILSNCDRTSLLLKQ